MMMTTTTTTMAKILTLSWTRSSMTSHLGVVRNLKEEVAISKSKWGRNFIVVFEGGGYSNAKFCESAACF